MTAAGAGRDRGAAGGPAALPATWVPVDSLGLTDAGMAMGPSFRASFGPGGLLATPSAVASARGGDAPDPAPGVTVCRVETCREEGGARVARLLAEHRRLNRMMRESALADGEGDGDGDGDGGGGELPLRELGSVGRGELFSHACEALADAALGRRDGDGDAAAAGGAGGGEAVAGLWLLVRDLFCEIPGEEADPDPLRRAQQGLRAHCRRRALVSSRLARAVAAEVAADAARASAGEPGGPDAVVAYLSGHALDKAVAAAAARGDPRLAATLAGAAAHASARGAVAAQVAAWVSSGAAERGAVAPARLQAYQLAAGLVLDCLRELPVLPWPRVLGMHVWYEGSPAAALGEAVEAYEGSVLELGPEWHPYPRYTRAGGPALESAPRARRVYDTAYEAVRLATGQAPAGGREGAVSPLARLLRPVGHTADRLDYSTAWCLAGVMGAAGCLRGCLGEEPAPWELAQVCRGAVAQLEAHPALAHWAVYAALHLPPGAGGPGAVDALVEELVTRGAPAWEADPDARAFLLDVLGPRGRAVLDRASAALERFRGCPGEELMKALDAGDAGAARELLCATEGPRMVLDWGPRARATLRQACAQLGGGGGGPRTGRGLAVLGQYLAVRDLEDTSVPEEEEMLALRRAMAAVAEAESGWAASPDQRLCLQSVAMLLHRRSCAWAEDAVSEGSGRRHLALRMLRGMVALQSLPAEQALLVAQRTAAIALENLSEGPFFRGG